MKNLLIPYAFLVVVLPAMVTYWPNAFGLPTAQWELIIDGLMAVTALLGMLIAVIRRKREFSGVLPLFLLMILVLLPQLYLWDQSAGSFRQFRAIYRFALLYITLYILPLEVHLSKQAVCGLIGAYCIFGFFCCGYEVWQHPNIFEMLLTGDGYRVVSFFQQRNRFAAYIALWLILCVFAEELSHKPIWLLPAAVFSFFLLLTKSRGSLLLAGVFLLCCLISYWRQIGIKNLLMILIDIAIIGALLWIFTPTRNFILNLIDVERGVSGRDRIWSASWNYYQEGNTLFGHGLGTDIERILIERLSVNVSTHNVYLYVLNLGGICLMLFYAISVILLLRLHCHRPHYLIPLLIATAAYGMFELACASFDYWHLSNMFTVCIFFIPAVTVVRRPRNYIPIHGASERV